MLIFIPYLWNIECVFEDGTDRIGVPCECKCANTLEESIFSHALHSHVVLLHIKYKTETQKRETGITDRLECFKIAIWDICVWQLGAHTLHIVCI